MSYIFYGQMYNLLLRLVDTYTNLIVLEVIEPFASSHSGSLPIEEFQALIKAKQSSYHQVVERGG